jgi:hypothetical protein
MASQPFDTSGGPRLQAYQPYERPNVLSDAHTEQTALIRVGTSKEARDYQYDLARGVKDPFLAMYASFINVLQSTTPGVYYVEVIYQRPDSQADYDAAAPLPGPAL